MLLFEKFYIIKAAISIIAACLKANCTRAIGNIDIGDLQFFPNRIYRNIQIYLAAAKIFCYDRRVTTQPMVSTKTFERQRFLLREPLLPR
jgi:hypothetical protein